MWERSNYGSKSTGYLSNQLAEEKRTDVVLWLDGSIIRQALRYRQSLPLQCGAHLVRQLRNDEKE